MDFNFAVKYYSLLNSKHTATGHTYRGLSAVYQLPVATGARLELSEKSSSKVEAKTCFLTAGVLHSQNVRVPVS